MIGSGNGKPIPARGLRDGQATQAPDQGLGNFHKARTEPSATCHDPRQISLFDYDKAKAFAKLDAAIEAYEAYEARKREER